MNTQLDVQSEKLNHSNQQIQILFQDVREIIATVSSCSDIPQYKPSGEYWIVTNSSSSPVQVYCDMNRTEPPLRTCGRSGPGSVSITYPTYGVEYSRVCGRVIGYQYNTSDAFAPYFLNITVSIVLMV